MRKRLFLGLGMLLAVAVAALGVLHFRSTRSAAPRQPVAKYLVLMVLDGARPDYLTSTKLPHLDALRARGTQYANAVSGILEAETPAGHATISTGTRPSRDGILGFDWVADGSRFSLFSPDQMESLVQIVHQSGVPTIAGLYKAQHPQAKVVALSGHKYYAAAPLGGPSADAILYYQTDPQGRWVPVAVPGHVPPARILTNPALVYPTNHLPDGEEDHLATNLALSVVGSIQPRILMINYPEFDWPLGHVDGGSLDPAKVVTDMQEFDADLGRIESAYRKKGILSQTLFVVTADHGMMPITHFVPAGEINNAITQAGTTAPDIASATGDFIWLADPDKAQTVAQNILAIHDPGIQSAYYLTTTGGTATYLPASGSDVSEAEETANEYLLDSLLNGHQPTVVVFGREGTTFSDPSSGWKADHGGNSWQSQQVPLILAGPGIKPGQVTRAPAQLDDIAPTVLAAMGVRPVGMDGHVLAEAMTQPTARAQAVRAAEVRHMRPILAALSSQS